MSDAVIFRDLPATFPEKDQYQRPSVIGSVLFHGLLVATVIIIPLLLPQSIPERELLMTLVSPVGPPGAVAACIGNTSLIFVPVSERTSTV